MKFNIKNLPNLQGKTVLVTGGNSGLGFECAKALLNKGAEVHILCRNKAKGEAALQTLIGAKLSILDLADLQAVKEFTKRFCSETDKLDILINNAGVMNVAKHTLTKNGLETQVGVNHFGHFALTMGLLPLLKKADKPRVVTVASIAAYNTELDFDNLNGEKYYNPYDAYKRSKLCNILFANELAVRNPWLVSVAAHPGVTHTAIQRNMKEPKKTLFTGFQFTFGHNVTKAAEPIICAAAIPNIKSGMYLGSKYVSRGPVALVRKPSKARSKRRGAGLWQISQEVLDKIN